MKNRSVEFYFYCKECTANNYGTMGWMPAFILKIVFLVMLSLLTTLANSFLIYVAYKTKSLVSNTKVFVISICVAHFFGSVIIIPSWIVSRMIPEVAKEHHFCDIVSFTWVLMILTSFYSLSAMSLDRYFIISNPMLYPFQATTRRKGVALFCIWTACIAFALAPIFGWGEYKFQPDAIPFCGLNMRSSLSYTGILMIFGFVIPLVIDMISCTRILAIARRQSIAIEERKSSFGSLNVITVTPATSKTNILQSAKLNKLKQKLNSLRLVFAGTGSFLICWVPYLGAHTWMVFVKPQATLDEETMPYILEFSVMFVALSNSFINPIVILLTNRDYKRKIRQLLYLRCGCFEESIMDERSDLDTSDTLRKSEVPVKNTFDKTKYDLKRTSVVTLDKCSEIHTSTTTVDIISDLQEHETNLSDDCEILHQTIANVSDLVVK